MKLDGLIDWFLEFQWLRKNGLANSESDANDSNDGDLDIWKS